jgi:hypothetical protein
LKDVDIRPIGAYWNEKMGEFILPYEDVRSSPSPEKTIEEFLSSTYEAVSNLGHWDRAFLERKIA